MIPLKTIEDLISKHSVLEKELSSGEVDKKLFAEKSKEYSDLNEVIDDARKYFSYEGEKKDLEKNMFLSIEMEKNISLHTYQLKWRKNNSPFQLIGMFIMFQRLDLDSNSVKYMFTRQSSAQ